MKCNSCNKKTESEIISDLITKNQILLAALKDATKDCHDSSCVWYENLLEKKCNCNLGKIKQKLLLF